MLSSGCSFREANQPSTCPHFHGPHGSTGAPVCCSDPPQLQHTQLLLSTAVLGSTQVSGNAPSPFKSFCEPLYVTKENQNSSQHLITQQDPHSEQSWQHFLRWPEKCSTIPPATPSSGSRLCGHLGTAKVQVSQPVPSQRQIRSPDLAHDGQHCAQSLISCKIKHFKREYVTFFNSTVNSSCTAFQTALLRQLVEASNP